MTPVVQNVFFSAPMHFKKNSQRNNYCLGHIKTRADFFYFALPAY